MAYRISNCFMKSVTNGSEIILLWLDRTWLYHSKLKILVPGIVMGLSFENCPKSEELSIQYPGADNLWISVFRGCSITCMTLLFTHTQGDGTRSGTGLCSCNDGYKGSMCDQCTDGYYQQATGNIKLCNSKYKTLSLALRYSSGWKILLLNHLYYISLESSPHQKVKNHHIFFVASNGPTLWVIM